MKRWLINGVISCYLLALAWGIGSHAFQFHSASHPAMYMVVWDMFCGWSAWETRFHVVAEGESGKHYEVAPAPWGTFTPYGNLGRHHYDLGMHGMWEYAEHAIENTEHEPISRVMIVEESWAKKYNLPDPVWEAYFDAPKVHQRYYRTRAVHSTSGARLYAKAPWVSSLFAYSLLSNPRIKAEFRREKPVFAVSRSNRNSGVTGSAFGSNTTFSMPNAN